VPNSARLVVLGAHASNTGCLRVYELEGHRLALRGEAKGRAPSRLARLRPPAWLIATSPPATVTVRALAQREDGDFAIKQQHSCLSAKESCV